MDAVVSPDLQATFERERDCAQRAKPRDSESFRALTVRMYGRLAQFQAEAITQEKADIACSRGCSFCCHLRVEIRPHEAFVLAHHIQARFSAMQRAKLDARIAANLRRIEPLTPQEHVRAGIPCALLEDGICSVYEARPAACRKYYSLSLKTCRDAYTDTSAPLTGPLENETVRLAGNAVVLGFAKGREDVGFDAKLYELHFALRRALDGSQAERRYRAGKKPFV